jgi:hypothetical protein
MAEPGDLFVVRTTGLPARVIRWFTRSHFNHAGVIVDDVGGTVEAKPSGAVRGNLADYSADEVLTGAPRPLTVSERSRVVVMAVGLLGTPYGWLDIVSLALLRFGVRLRPVLARVARYDRLTCGELADLAYRRAGIQLFTDSRPSFDVTPGDLAGLLPHSPPDEGLVA